MLGKDRGAKSKTQQRPTRYWASRSVIHNDDEIVIVFVQLFNLLATYLINTDILPPMPDKLCSCPRRNHSVLQALEA